MHSLADVDPRLEELASDGGADRGRLSPGRAPRRAHLGARGRRRTSPCTPTAADGGALLYRRRVRGGWGGGCAGVAARCVETWVRCVGDLGTERWLRRRGPW